MCGPLSVLEHCLLNEQKVLRLAVFQRIGYEEGLVGIAATAFQTNSAL